MEKSQFLQLMRFVAAGLVLCAHITFYYHERVSAAVDVWTQGAVGVPIFFVISGIVMVVASRHLPNGPVGAKEFILRRVIRIVPLWWLALTIKVAVALMRPEVVNHNHFRFDDALKSFFFVPYFNNEGTVVPLHGVGWTLLHEMFFYILFSCAVLLKMRPAFWVSVTIVALSFAGFFWPLNSPWWSVATSATNLQFVFGMALASALLQPGFTRRRRRGVAAALVVAAAACCLPPLEGSIHFMYPVLLIFAAATLCLIDWQLPRRLQWGVKLGDSSYSLYLFHPFLAPAAVLAAAATFPRLSAWWHMLAVFVLTTALCHVLHLIVEVPVVNIARRRLLGQQDRARPQVAQSA